MKSFLAALVYFTLVGCGSKSYDTGLKPTVVSSVDPYNKSIVVDYSYENGITNYKRMLKSKRINSLKDFSCFKKESFYKHLRFVKQDTVNYVEMIESDIKFYRSLHVDNIKTITYKKTEGFVDETHARIYKEDTVDKLKVYRRSCIIGDKYVVSEAYYLEG